MPELPSTSLVLQHAFAPARKKKPDANQTLKTLYDGEAPYYAEDAPGSMPEIPFEVEDRPTFTPEEMSKISRYNDQIGRLITAIYETQVKYGFDHDQLNNLITFSMRIKSRTYYTQQTNEYYQSIKHYLENIVVAIATDDPATIKENRIIMHDLLNEIAHCGPGIFSHIKNASNLLSNEHSIETWLAKLREIIIRQLADAHSIKYKIPSGDTVHVLNVLFGYACDQGWNPLGFESHTAVNEIHHSLACVEHDDILVFHQDFFAAYTPLSILTTITDCMYDNFSRRLTEGNKANASGVNFTIVSDCTDFFVGLPLINKAGMINVLFKQLDDEENPGVDVPELTFTFAGSRYQLKSSTELKLSLTRFYLTPESDRLFQGFFQDIDEKSSFGIVVRTPELCYFYTRDDDSIKQLNHCAPHIDLSIFKDQGIPLTQICFDYYVKKGVRDFRQCILEDVNLIETDVESLNFAGVSLRNVTVSATQFIAVCTNGCTLTTSSLLLDNTIAPCIQDCLDDAAFLTHLLTVKKTNLTRILHLTLYTMDNPALVEYLVKRGANLAMPNENNLTAAQVATKRKLWACLEAMAKFVKNNEDDKCRFGDALISVMEFNKMALAKLLLTKKARAKGKVSPFSKNTCLHWAAEYNHIGLLDSLVSEVDAKALNNLKLTAVDLALNQQHWTFILGLAARVRDTGNDLYGYALPFAIHQKQAKVVKAILAAGTSPNLWRSARTQSSCLHLAVSMNSPAIVTLLLLANADAAAINLNNVTPIQMAADGKYYECITSFIENREDTDGAFRFGYALVQMYDQHQYQLVGNLLIRKADVNTQLPSSLDTCLHICTRRGRFRDIPVLMGYRANLALTNSEDLTPIQTIGNKHWLQETISHLMPFLAENNVADTYRLGFAVAVAIKFNYVELAITLIEFNADVNKYTLDGDHCLHLAVKLKSKPLIMRLLEAKADATLTNAAGISAVELANQSDQQWKEQNRLQFFGRDTHIINIGKIFGAVVSQIGVAPRPARRNE
jgi:ankyrin repeat protein